MLAKLKTAVLGATGYSGLELTRLLLRHPLLGKPVLLRRSETDVACNLAEVFPSLSGNGSYPLQPLSWPALKRQDVDLLLRLRRTRLRVRSCPKRLRRVFASLI